MRAEAHAGSQGEGEGPQCVPRMTSHTHTQASRVARVFQDVNGWYYCDENLGFLDARSGGYASLSAMLSAIENGNMHREIPYTHYIRGNVKRRIHP